MKLNLFLVLIASLNCSFAAINTQYQYGNPPVIESSVLPISNNPIILNPALDDIDANDPKIKSIINYTKTNGLGVSVVFFNPENLRFAKQINAMFNANGIKTTNPQMAASKNKMDFNLVQIYAIKDKNKLSESTPALMKKGAN